MGTPPNENGEKLFLMLVHIPTYPVEKEGRLCAESVRNTKRFSHTEKRKPTSNLWLGKNDISKAENLIRIVGRFWGTGGLGWLVVYVFMYIRSSDYSK